MGRRSSAAGGVVDARGLERRGLQLFGQREGFCRRLARQLLRFHRGGRAQQQRAAKLVMETLVGLDDVAVERGRDLVPRPLAELDELAVLDDGIASRVNCPAATRSTVLFKVSR